MRSPGFIAVFFLQSRESGRIKLACRRIEVEIRKWHMIPLGDSPIVLSFACPEAFVRYAPWQEAVAKAVPVRRRQVGGIRVRSHPGPWRAAGRRLVAQEGRGAAARTVCRGNVRFAGIRRWTRPTWGSTRMPGERVMNCPAWRSAAVASDREANREAARASAEGRAPTAAECRADRRRRRRRAGDNSMSH
jgi:hypothetical protein